MLTLVPCVQANLDQTSAWVIGSAAAVKNADRIIRAEDYTSSLFNEFCATNVVASCASAFDAVPEDAALEYPVE